MDIFLFIVGILFLFFRRYEYVIAIIILLLTTYLQLQISEASNFLFPHNVSDIGLLLYLFFFLTIAFRYGITAKHPLVKYVNIFYLFLLLSGLYDILSGVTVGDVIRYLRNWFCLTIIYIVPFIKPEWTVKSLKIIYNITLLLCLIILLQTFTSLEIIHLIELDGRGMKAPSYSIYCASLCLINVLNYPLRKRIIDFIIFILPMVLNLKMTYVLSVFFIYFIYILFTSGWSVSRKVIILLFFLIVSSGVILSNDKFYDRFISMTQQSKVLNGSTESGTFSFRLLLAGERLQYICNSPETMIRGIGFVSENNFHEDIFSIGLWDEARGRYFQLDTGDIAWAVFFIRLGLGGILIYLIFYFNVIKYFVKYHNYRYNKYSAFIISLMIVFLFFTSFGNALITMDDFFIYPLLFTNFYRTEKYEDNSLYL